MKKVYLSLIAPLVIVGVISFQQSSDFSVEKYLAKNGHILNASGAPAGQTGAPGEQTCTGCHSGTALAGANENTLVVANGTTPTLVYTPGMTYNILLTMASNPSKKGFQATALTSSGAMAGTFTAGLNTTISGSTKKYANHNSMSNNSGTPGWLWTWTAPSTNVGNVTFYVATNLANGNGSDSGDKIYLSQHILTSTAGVEELATSTNFTAAYSPENNAAVVKFTSLTVGDMYLNLVDLNGRSVFTANLGTAQIGDNKEVIALPELKNGIYVANFFVNNHAMSARLMVSH